MKVTRFDTTLDLIVERARVWGPGGDTLLNLAVDTGSTATVITPDLVDDLGYSPRDGEAITVVRSAIGKEQGYTLRMSRFEAFGFAFPNYEVHVFDLAAGYGIDGLIGLSLLKQFNYEIRSAEGRILADKLAS